VTTTGLRERKKAATRLRIEVVADELFLGEGYDAVTLDMVAAECDISIRTVLRYFQSKDQLALAHHHDALERFSAELAEPGDETVEGLWRAHVARGAAAVNERRRWFRAHLSMVEAVPALTARYLAIHRAYEDLLSDHLARQARRRCPDLDDRLLAATLVAGNLAVVRHWHAKGGRGDLASLCLSVVDRATERFSRA
jgi:AcrR family transcriptional regulator